MSLANVMINGLMNGEKDVGTEAIEDWLAQARIKEIKTSCFFENLRKKKQLSFIYDFSYWN